MRVFGPLSVTQPPEGRLRNLARQIGRAKPQLHRGTPAPQ